MADYFTQTVISHAHYLTQDMADVLEARGAELDPTGEERTILDSLAGKGIPAKEYHITFSEGWNDWPEEFEEWAEDYAADDPNNYSEGFKELFELDRANFLYQVLLLDPEAVAVEVQESQSCSKMRTDGFGGSSLTVTRKGYLFLYTGNIEIDDDGTIRSGAKFVPWDDQKEGSNGQQAA